MAPVSMTAPAHFTSLSHRMSLCLALAAVCLSTGCSDDDLAADRPYPEASAYGELTGPGGPSVSFQDGQLNEVCQWLSGGPEDTLQHHNLVTMYDGLLLMPWSPESSVNGGLTFFDFSDPCNSKVVGSTSTKRMRESHSIGFSERGGSWAVVNHGEVVPGSERPFEGGALFWDVSDPTAPKEAGVVKFDEFVYPDAYAFVVLSVFWQGDYVYVAGADNGVYIVDATDPTAPKLVGRYLFDPVLRAGQVIAVGNLLVVTSAEQARAVLLDISNPTEPEAIIGGDFITKDVEGKARKAYFSNVAAGHIFFTRKDNGGGLMVYDIRDPSQPKYAGGYKTDGKGGYVFIKDNLAVTGESNHAVIFDISDLSDIKEVRRLKMSGDLDTANPIGNVVVLSVDDKPDLVNAAGSGVVPLALEPDVTGPTVTWAFPADGAVDLALTSRFGVTVSEPVEPKTAWEGSVRLYETLLGPAKGRVDGDINAQDLVINFSPLAPLKPTTQYTLELPAGGVADPNGNGLLETFKVTFSTGSK